MPRSFLVRQYFRRKYYWLIDDSYDEDEENEADRYMGRFGHRDSYLNFTETPDVTPSIDSYQWNYEAEKSYWFELSGHKERLQQLVDDGLQNIQCKIAQGGSLTNDDNSKRGTQAKIEHTTELTSADSIASENVEEKLQQMLQENPDIVKKNIKQFLDNNRILLKEMAFEIGIEEESIRLYIEGKEAFTKEQREEFYRWYLLKIFRPPSGLDEKSFTCYKCGKIFAYESYLERHIKYVCPDNTGRTWKCSYCGKAFQYPCYLKRHIRSHTGESPYKCDQCDRAFVRSTDLQRHIRNHTGEKPYKCSECERAFARSTDLKRHMRTHTGEKPYKCWQCGKTFSQSGSLQTHLHTHNKDSNASRKYSKGSK